MAIFADPYALTDEEKRRQMAAQEFFKQSLPVTRYSYNEQPQYSPLRMPSTEAMYGDPATFAGAGQLEEAQSGYMSQQPMGRQVPYRREQYVAKDKGDGKNKTLDAIMSFATGLGTKALDVALPGAGTAATFVKDAATTGDVKGAAMSAAGDLAGGAAGDVLKKSPKTSAAKKSSIRSYYDTDEYKALSQYPTVSFDEFNTLSAMNPDERKVEQSRISDRAMALSLAQDPQAGRDAIRLNTLTPEMRAQLGAIGRAGLSAVDENKGPEAMPFRVDPANRAYYAELASLAAKPVQPAQIASPVQMAAQDRGMGGFEKYPIVEKSRGFNSYPIVPRSAASTIPSVPAVSRETITSPQQIAAQDLVKQSVGRSDVRDYLDTVAMFPQDDPVELARMMRQSGFNIPARDVMKAQQSRLPRLSASDVINYQPMSDAEMLRRMRSDFPDDPAAVAEAARAFGIQIPQAGLTANLLENAAQYRQPVEMQNAFTPAQTASAPSGAPLPSAQPTRGFQALGQQGMRRSAMGQIGAGQRMGIDAGPPQQVAENQIYNQMIAPSNVAVGGSLGDYSQMYGGMNAQADAMLNAAAGAASDVYNPTAAFDANQINAARLRLNARGVFEDMMSPQQYQAALVSELVTM